MYFQSLKKSVLPFWHNYDCKQAKTDWQTDKQNKGMEVEMKKKEIFIKKLN